MTLADLKNRLGDDYETALSFFDIKKPLQEWSDNIALYLLYERRIEETGGIYHADMHLFYRQRMIPLSEKERQFADRVMLLWNYRNIYEANARSLQAAIDDNRTCVITHEKKYLSCGMCVGEVTQILHRE